MNLQLKTIKRNLFLQAAALVILFGCGDDSELTNGVPIAQAAGNQKAEIGSVVKLDASGSNDPDGDALTFNWSFTSKPAGSFASIIGAGKEQAEFTLDKAGAYEVELKVSDGISDAIASLTITNKTPILSEINTSTSYGLDEDLAQRGRTISITGDFFSGDITENKVTVGDVTYEIEELFSGADADFIRVKVPEDAISGELKITVGEESVVSATPIRIIDVPVDAFVVENTQLEEKTRIDPGSYFEIGARIKPLVNGKAVALTLRMPVDGSYKVTLWDGASKTVLVTQTIEITNRSLRVAYLSTEIVMEKGKVYMITVNADNWYNHIDEQDSQGNQYPQTIGNFDYLSLGFNDGQATEYPDKFPVNYITKGADLIFAEDVQ